MGIKIAAVNPKGSIPRKCFLELTCDMDHGLFPAPSKRFQTGSFVVDYAAAMKAGWLDRSNSHGRLFLCPECSQK